MKYEVCLCLESFLVFLPGFTVFIHIYICIICHIKVIKNECENLSVQGGNHDLAPEQMKLLVYERQKNECENWFRGGSSPGLSAHCGEWFFLPWLHRTKHRLWLALVLRPEGELCWGRMDVFQVLKAALLVVLNFASQTRTLYFYCRQSIFNINIKVLQGWGISCWQPGQAKGGEGSCTEQGAHTRGWTLCLGKKWKPALAAGNLSQPDCALTAGLHK